MKTRYEFTITGFIIALIVVALVMNSLGTFLTDLKTEYNITTNTSFDGYDKTKELINLTETTRNKTTIKQEAGLLDVIGGYFSAGYSALKTSITSFGIFEDLTEEASTSHPILAFFMEYLKAIILISLFVGVLIAVLVKMRV